MNCKSFRRRRPNKSPSRSRSPRPAPRRARRTDAAGPGRGSAIASDDLSARRWPLSDRHPRRRAGVRKLQLRRGRCRRADAGMKPEKSSAGTRAALPAMLNSVASPFRGTGKAVVVRAHSPKSPVRNQRAKTPTPRTGVPSGQGRRIQLGHPKMCLIGQDKRIFDSRRSLRLQHLWSVPRKKRGCDVRNFLRY